LIEAVIAEEEPASGAADWRIGIHLGRGPIPESPQATIRLGAEQAEAIRDGGLHPVEALITGQLRLEGDLGLILQLQAVAMLVMMPPTMSG
jgi:putative sterol carrier protein